MSEKWTYEYAYPVPASPDRVFTALTTKDELERWFAEHARVDAREGGRFEFWGRHTVGSPSQGGAGGTITAFDPQERLGFTWEMFGVPSQVTITLAPEESEHGPGTKVAIRHDFEDGVFDMPRSKEMVDDWWRFNLGNLMAHTADFAEVMRVDFEDESPEINLSMHMDAPPSKVFRALTEPEALNKWMAKDAVVDLRVGGTWDLGFSAPGVHEGPPMQILELVPDEKLVVSWPDWRGDSSLPVQSVTWLLEPAGEGTKVTLIHAGFVRTVDLSDYPFGWGYFLSQLKGVVEEM